MLTPCPYDPITGQGRVSLMRDEQQKAAVQHARDEEVAIKHQELKAARKAADQRQAQAVADSIAATQQYEREEARKRLDAALRKADEEAQRLGYLPLPCLAWPMPLCTAAHWAARTVLLSGWRGNILPGVDTANYACVCVCIKPRKHPYHALLALALWIVHCALWPLVEFVKQVCCLVFLLLCNSLVCTGRHCALEVKRAVEKKRASMQAEMDEMQRVFDAKFARSKALHVDEQDALEELEVRAWPWWGPGVRVVFRCKKLL